MLLHRGCEARIDLRRKKEGAVFFKGSIGMQQREYNEKARHVCYQPQHRKDSLQTKSAEPAIALASRQPQPLKPTILCLNPPEKHQNAVTSQRSMF